MVAGTLLFALSDCSGDEFTQEAADASVDSGGPQEASTGGSGGTSTGGAGGATGGSGGAPTGGAGGATGGTGASAGHAGTGGDAGPEPTCDPNESPPTDAIYVSAKEGDDNASQGSPEQPLQSLSNAIKLAVHNQIGKIILDQGTYKEAVVLSLQDPLVIMGGWIKVGTAWTRDCSQTARNKTLLHSPTSTGLQITGNSSVSLQTMVIQSTGTNNAAPDNQSGESCYGVFVSGAELSMNDVTIRACGGQDGGKANKYEEVQPPDCSQLQGTGCSMGEHGGSGSGGQDAKEAGTFTLNGYTLQTDSMETMAVMETTVHQATLAIPRNVMKKDALGSKCPALALVIIIAVTKRHRKIPPHNRVPAVAEVVEEAEARAEGAAADPSEFMPREMLPSL